MRLMRELMHMGVLSDAAVALLEDPKAWLQALDKTRRAVHGGVRRVPEAGRRTQRRVPRVAIAVGPASTLRKQAEVMPYMKLLGIVNCTCTHRRRRVSPRRTSPRSRATTPWCSARSHRDRTGCACGGCGANQADKIGEAVLRAEGAIVADVLDAGCTFPAVIAGGVCAEWRGREGEAQVRVPRGTVRHEF
jgi:hypothetical protein